MPTRRKKTQTTAVPLPPPTRGSWVVPLLVGLLVIASFFIGALYTKVQYLEKTLAGGVPQGIAQGVQPTLPPKAEVKVADTDPMLGPKDAKVTVVVFEDFQCPFCGAFAGLNADMVKNMQSRDATYQPAIPGIKKEYVEKGKVRLVWKDYPFLGQESHWAGAAARCAGDQGKFWEYHDYLFSHQDGENQGTFSKENLKKFAGNIGLKTPDFNECIESGKYDKQMQEAPAYGQSVGVQGTPATFVNGKFVSGAASFSQLKALIDAELK